MSSQTVGRWSQDKDLNVRAAIHIGLQLYIDKERLYTTSPILRTPSNTKMLVYHFNIRLFDMRINLTHGYLLRDLTVSVFSSPHYRYFATLLEHHITVCFIDSKKLRVSQLR